MYILGCARITFDAATVVGQAGDGTHHVPLLTLCLHVPARVGCGWRLLFLLLRRATEERVESVRYLVKYVLRIFLTCVFDVRLFLYWHFAAL